MLIADLILVIHALFVAFIVLGLAAVLLGGHLHWGWVRNWWFRMLHALAMVFVALESWLGLICPLTEWENRSRLAAGGAVYTESFIQYWLHKILYYDLPSWVFTATYTAVAILVLLAWLLVPPKEPRRAR